MQTQTRLIRHFVVFCIIISFCSILLIKLMGYIDENTALNVKNNKLMTQNRALALENDFLNHKKRNNLNQYSYNTWITLNELADELVADSGGEFKKSWALYLVQESQKYDINPYIPYELLKIETGGSFNPHSVGPDTKFGRAYGMAQFMKNTAPWIADMAGISYEDDMLFDPYYSIHLTFVYLDFLYHQFNDWDKALTAYHRGIGGMERFIEDNGHAKSWYAVEILSNAKQYQRVSQNQ